ncbi:MAG: hypothetical protein AAGG48_14745 [Planctomycetota bacterium]
MSRWIHEQAIRILSLKCRRLKKELAELRNEQEQLGVAWRLECELVEQVDARHKAEVAELKAAITTMRIVQYEMQQVVREPSRPDDDPAIWVCVVDWQRRLTNAVAVLDGRTTTESTEATS